MNFIVDSHCHLNLLEEKGFNIDEMVVNAANSNVKFLQTICTKITEFKKIYSYSQKYTNVFASVGIHPNNVDEEPKTSAADLVKLINENHQTY